MLSSENLHILIYQAVRGCAPAVRLNQLGSVLFLFFFINNNNIHNSLFESILVYIYIACYFPEVKSQSAGDFFLTLAESNG